MESFQSWSLQKKAKNMGIVLSVLKSGFQINLGSIGHILVLALKCLERKTSFIRGIDRDLLTASRMLMN